MINTLIYAILDFLLPLFYHSFVLFSKNDRCAAFNKCNVNIVDVVQKEKENYVISSVEDLFQIIECGTVCLYITIIIRIMIVMLIMHSEVVYKKFLYEKLFWVNPTHLVPKQGGKFRLITDCTKVNKFMKHTHFKMEGVPTLKDIIEKNEHAITFDLKEAYNHMPVHHSMKNLLCMCWEDYRFVGMPFGLNYAPGVFTKIMKHVVRTIREI
jgi:hypothetical protein